MECTLHQCLVVEGLHVNKCWLLFVLYQAPWLMTVPEPVKTVWTKIFKTASIY